MRTINRSALNSPLPKLFEYTHGMDLDRHFFRHEIRVQGAWVKGLEQIKVLSSEEARHVLSELQVMQSEMADENFLWRHEDEDIHMAIERRLTEKVGELGQKIHLGRSRNDLIATSLRLHVAHSLVHGAQLTAALAQQFHDLAKQNELVLVPGSTHLQHAQPLRFSHILAAHALGLLRDLRRLQMAIEGALAYLPLGSAALSGSSLTEMPLAAMAEELGFHEVSANSYDAVGDRDFILEALDAIATSGVHLSRFCEDVIYWSSTPVALVRLAPEWSTGSSIMPNKRNPDVAELSRAKSAQLCGFAAMAKTLLKALPSSYSSDLHELKRVFQNALEQWLPMLEILAPFVGGLTLDAERAAELLALGDILATEYANRLTVSGLPFRQAYAEVAEWIAQAQKQNTTLAEIAAQRRPDWLSAQAGANKNPSEAEAYLQAVESRRAAGGTSLTQLRLTLNQINLSLAEFRDSFSHGFHPLSSPLICTQDDKS